MKLMHRNNLVYDFNTGKIYRTDLLPYVYGREIGELHHDLVTWVNKRATPIQRKHAEKIYKYLGLPKTGSSMEMMVITHGLSINDNYWISNDIQNIESWEKINLFNNKLSDTLAYLALTGTPISITNDHISAEFTGQGAYAKCISREEIGLVLYKAGTDFEIGAEEFASHVAEQLGVRTAKYYKSSKFGINTIASPICTNENISWTSAFSSTKFFEQQYGMNVYDFASMYFPIPFYQMAVLDGLILNPDRHLQNWSFEIDGYTNQILGLAPCYDYNKAFTGTRTDMSREIPHNNLLSAARMAFPNSGISTDNMLKLISLIGMLPKNLQDPFYNRVLYILNKKSSQDKCY